MSKESREFNKKRRHFRKEINSEFNETAKRFITDIFRLENKKIPKFEKLSNDEILEVYSKTLNGLNHKLMMHRHKPIAAEYLDELRYINSCDALPKSTKIILESLS